MKITVHIAAASVTVAALCLAASARHADPPADLVVTNARIWTADPEQPRAEALAVRDGRFIAVGTSEQVKRHIGEHTRTLDAEKRRVLPGLIDTHVHLNSAAAERARLQLRDAPSREALLEKVADHARTLADDAWLIGVRWTAESWPDQRPPTAEEVDRAAGGRPAILVRMDGHMLIAGSAALELAGITPEGPDDPPGGRIGRFHDGTPDGALYEQAMRLVYAHMPDDEDPATQRTLMRSALREAASLGLTHVGAIEPRDTIELLARLDRAGELPIRIAATVRSGATTLDQWRPTLEWADANRGPSPRVRVLGFKGFMDGTLGSRTAWQTRPYLDDPRDRNNTGFPLSMAADGSLRELILLGASMNLQPAVHAIGDRANTVLLDWYARIPDQRRRALRPRVEHAQHLQRSDVHRFADLGVVPSMQPLHKADDGRYAEQRLPLEHLRYSYAYRSLLDAGAPLAFGSDWPVVPADPFRAIHAAVASRTLDGQIFLPEQAISVEEALTAYTVTAAHALHAENVSGTIRTGRPADFIILDRDILEIEPDRIPGTKVLHTFTDGLEIHTHKED